MKLHVDIQADALYLRLDDATPVADSEEVAPGVVLDFDADGRVVGIEMLRLSTRTPALNLRALQFETT